MSSPSSVSGCVRGKGERNTEESAQTSTFKCMLILSCACLSCPRLPQHGAGTGVLSSHALKSDRPILYRVTKHLALLFWIQIEPSLVTVRVLLNASSRVEELLYFWLIHKCFKPVQAFFFNLKIIPCFCLMMIVEFFRQGLLDCNFKSQTQQIAQTSRVSR